MDFGQLARDLTSFLAPLLPYLQKAGEKAAEEAGKGMGGETWEKAKSIWVKLRPKVEGKPAAIEAAQDATKEPHNERAKGALEWQLMKLLAEDDVLAKEIARLWGQAKATEVVNQNVRGDRNVTIGGSSISGTTTIITADKIDFNNIEIPSESARLSTLLAASGEIYFADLISYHCSVFAGRSDEISKIRKSIAENDQGYIFVEGPSGYGKTALLAYLTQIFPSASYHFINQAMRHGSDIFDPNRETDFLANLLQQLRRKSATKESLTVQNLRASYLSLLSTAPVDTSPRMIIIDAIDEVDQEHNFLRGLFPHRLAKHTYVVFSARTIGDRNYLRLIGLSPADVSTTIKLDRFDLAGVAALLEKAGGQAAMWAGDHKFVEVLLETTHGDPFHLRFLVEDVRDGIIGPRNIKDTPRGLYDYLDLQFEMLSESAVRRQQRDILGYILNANAPLSRAALISLVVGLDSINFETTIRGIRRFFVEHQGAFTFCHERFRQYFLDKARSLNE